MDVICIGEALIDFFAVKSGVSFQDVPGFKRIAGGAPANVAVGCSKLGKKTAFIGRVGNDYFGLYLRDILSRNGVNVDMMQFDSRARTGLAFIALPTPTSREFLFYRNPGADMLLDAAQFDRNFIKDTIVFHFGSITLISEPGKSSTYEAVKIAKSGGALISLDPNLRIDLWPDAATAKRNILEAVPLADFIKLNDEELLFLTSEDDLKKGTKRLLDMGPAFCIVTLGSRGSYFATEKFNGRIPVFDVRTVDTTGCGDSFVAGLLAFFVEKGFNDSIKNRQEIIEIVRIATAAASITSMKKGVIPALPSLAEVMDFLKGRV
ncbi:MAG: hypothetical protein FJW66_04255 [Actinobacteria bacterium]|nr:hypothetical protein [Actinomycetota bacterium]